jgi:two-component system phosphate regulon response regulator PhoB
MIMRPQTVLVIDRTVDVHVTAIRRKLGKGAELIETIRGFGYKFRKVERASRGSKSATGAR